MGANILTLQQFIVIICIERAYIKVGVATVDLGDRRAVVTTTSEYV